MRESSTDPAAERLRTLQGEELALYALSLLAPAGRKETRRDTLRAALKVLAAMPMERAREPLAALFFRFARNGGVHDYGCYVRGDALRALRPLVTAAEIPLLELAATTYEFPPPSFVEEAGLLRSAALPALAELDVELARFHAARLLVDEYTERMSGEPAVSAARTLALLREPLSLYLYLCERAHQTHVEVVGECLRGLRSLPVRLLPGLIALILRRADERPGETSRRAEPPALAVRVALIDLMLEHDDGPQQIDYLLEEVRNGPPELLHYLLAAAVAAALTRGHDEPLAACVESLRFEARAARRAAAREALQPASGVAAVAELLEAWGGGAHRDEARRSSG